MSPSVPPQLVIAVDAASFVSALSGPRLSISSETTIHAESVPAPLVTGGIVASPERSLMQTDASALRVIFDASWALAGPTTGPTKRVAWLTATGW